MLRKAQIEDIKEIHTLINVSASQGEMLPRSLGELYDNLRDFFVYEEKGKVLGACALHVCWEDLAEVRSLCVTEESRYRGYGKNLVKACVDEAKLFRIKRIFVLTYQVDFFRKQGFGDIDKGELPHKIWSDCIKCPKFPECDEVAMIMLVRNNTVQ